MTTGTSGRAAFALGNSSRPLIPGMLMSDKIRMSEIAHRFADALGAPDPRIVQSPL